MSQEIPHTLHVQSSRDLELRRALAQDNGVVRALQKIKEHRDGRGFSYRRRLLSNTLRLTRSMSPEIADIVAHSKDLLGYEHPVEVYLVAAPEFNASCYRETTGPTIITLTSRLLEEFTPEELRFVIGHELGHASFGHFSIPMPLTVSLKQFGVPFVSQSTSLQLYAWCRYAEISADRIGMIVAGDPQAAATGLFKLASGTSSARVRPDLEAFAEQVHSLASAPEAHDKEQIEHVLDCFSTHPYNPIRVRAAWAFAQSVPYHELTGANDGAHMTLEEVEAMVEHDLALMEPNYLQRNDHDAEVLRSLLYTAGMAVAMAHGDVEPSELDALAALLGSQYGIEPSSLEHIEDDLRSRVDAARGLELRLRAQLVQHLTIIALADGAIQESEYALIMEIADDLGVTPYIVEQAIAWAVRPID